MIFYINENVLFNEKDIYYNKESFDNGDINLCFITGHSGSGKSTMTKKMNNIECYELDDLYAIADHFSMSDLKKYGDLIYSYFNGPGKKFYVTNEWLNKEGPMESEYEAKLFPGFVHYAMKYAKSHKDTRFVIEGVWLYGCNYSGDNAPWFDPEEFKDYAFYIKGTSMLISKIRAAKRDSTGDTKFDRFKSFSKKVTHYWSRYVTDEKLINRFRKYFINLMKNN